MGAATWQVHRACRRGRNRLSRLSPISLLETRCARLWFERLPNNSNIRLIVNMCMYIRNLKLTRAPHTLRAWMTFFILYECEFSR